MFESRDSFRLDVLCIGMTRIYPPPSNSCEQRFIKGSLAQDSELRSLKPKNERDNKTTNKKGQRRDKDTKHRTTAARRTEHRPTRAPTRQKEKNKKAKTAARDNAKSKRRTRQQDHKQKGTKARQGHKTQDDMGKTNGTTTNTGTNETERKKHPQRSSQGASTSVERSFFFLSLWKEINF